MLLPALAFFGAAGLLLLLVRLLAAERSRRLRKLWPSADELVSAATARLRVRPFDRMGSADRRIIQRMLHEAEPVAEPGELRGRVNLMLAEMAMISGDLDGALERYRAVKKWAPDASVGRTIQTLERRLSPSTPLSVRLGG